eukprot:9471762-Pyramimonas_sp.AAC.1
MLCTSRCAVHRGPYSAQHFPLRGRERGLLAAGEVGPVPRRRRRRPAVSKSYTGPIVEKLAACA